MEPACFEGFHISRCRMSSSAPPPPNVLGAVAGSGDILVGDVRLTRSSKLSVAGQGPTRWFAPGRARGFHCWDDRGIEGHYAGRNGGSPWRRTAGPDRPQRGRCPASQAWLFIFLAESLRIQGRPDEKSAQTATPSGQAGANSVYCHFCKFKSLSGLLYCCPTEQANPSR